MRIWNWLLFNHHCFLYIYYFISYLYFRLDSNGVFLLDSGPIIFIYVGGNCSPNFLRTAFGVPSIMEIQDISHELPVISTKQNEAIHAFIKSLNDEKPYAAVLNIIR